MRNQRKTFRGPVARGALTSLALGLLLTSCMPRATVADPAPNGLEPLGAGSDGKGGGVLAKLGRDLVALYEAYASFVGDATTPPRTFGAPDPTVRIVDGRVAVDATASGDPALLERDLTALGLMAVARFGPVVSGELPIEALDDAAALTSLRSMRAAQAGLR